MTCDECHGAGARGEMVLSVLGCLLLAALVGILLFWADAEQHAMRECRAFGYQDGFSTIRGDAICVKRTEVLLSDLQRGGNAVVGERKNGH